MTGETDMKDKLLLPFVLAVGLSLGACDVTGIGAATEDPDPGDGAVKCPGNKACPNVQITPKADAGEASTRGWWGIAGYEPGMSSDAKPKMIICDGTTRDGCPAGYVGRLVLKSTLSEDGLQTPTICRDGKAPCGTVDGKKTWAIICTDGRQGCPMLPRWRDPK